ncbi:SGNH/GDSL hydrolase family protein [Geodermatophilus sp. SYSU D01176]
MRGLQLERPPRWGIVALVVLVVANVALFALMALRRVPDDPYGATRAAAATSSVSASAPPAPAPQEPATPAVVAVYGDGYAAGNSFGGLGAAGWPAQVASRVDARLALHALPQAGYAAVGVTGQNLVQVVQSTPVPGATVTVLFGSRNDGVEPAATVQENATGVIAAVRAQAPGTTILVVGPVWDDGSVPAGVVAASDAVEAAARAAGVRFVDPLTEEWFAGPQPGLIAADGVSPTDAGHAYLAERIAPLVTDALDGPTPAR